MKTDLFALPSSLLSLLLVSSACSVVGGDDAAANAESGAVDPNGSASMLPGSNPSGGSSGGSSGGDDSENGPGVPDDNTKNGKETDVDCGGAAENTPRCAVGKACKVHSDCESNGCSVVDGGICAARASCTQLEGGHTCGPNDDDALSKQNDCCESAEVGGFTVDKYLVTAGRMRAFLTRVDNVRDWASKLPANKWDQSITPHLPTSMDGESGDDENANTQLGPFFAKRSCQTGDHTGHTFWTPEKFGDSKDFSKEILDTKALNCVPWWLISALCAFDGGHLATEAELRAAYTNGGSTSYPWGARNGYVSNAQTDFAVQEWSYVTDENAPSNSGGFLDIAANIAPPGRRPDGYNKTGHADLVGNLLEWVSDSERQFVWKGSFEHHASEADNAQPPLNNDPWMSRNPMTLRHWYWNEIAVQDKNPNGYYALGGRCAY